MSRKFGQSVSELNNSLTKSQLQLCGSLGVPLGGQKLIEVPGRNSFVYVRLRNNQNELIEAFNNQVAESYDLPVLVGREGNRYIILGVDTQRYGSNWPSYSAYLPRHGPTHSFFLENGGGGDIVWVYSRQIMPLLSIPSGSNGGPNVVISDYILREKDGSWKWLGETGTVNLLQYKPTGSDALMVLVYRDALSGNPGIIVGSGSHFPPYVTGTSQVLPYIPTTTNPNYIVDSAIRLVSGSHVIGWDNIYDVRQFFEPPSANGTSQNFFFFTSGSAGISTYDLMTQALPTGNYNYLSASISATGTQIGQFITEPNIPGTTFISDGIYHFHVHALITAGTKGADLLYQLFKYSGGVETLVYTSELTEPLSSAEQEYDLETFQSELSLGSTDRLLVKIFGFQLGGGSAPTVQIKFENNTLSRLEIPAIINPSTSSTVAIQDEGVAQGTAGTLNFVGPNVDVSVAGGVARIFITGSTGGGISSGTVQVFNTGTFLGSADKFDFQYPLAVGFTGTRAYPYLQGTLKAIEDVSNQIISGGTVAHFTLTGTIQQNTDMLYYNGLLQQRGTHYTVDSDGKGFQTLFTGGYTTPYKDVLIMEYGNLGAQSPIPTPINIYDDSVLKGSVGGVSFDSGLFAVVSGTTAFINSSKYINIQDQKASGTNGGTFTAGAWRTRDLNTIVVDETGLVSVGTNQITLPAGTYRIVVSCPALQVNRNLVRLQNITDAITLLFGQNAFSGASPDNTSVLAILRGKFTITATKTIEVQHIAETTYATYGFGVACGFGGVEVYTTVELWKVL